MQVNFIIQFLKLNQVLHNFVCLNKDKLQGKHRPTAVIWQFN